MKKLLVLSLLLGFSVPVIAHNEANGGSANHSDMRFYLDNKETTEPTSPVEMEVGEGADSLCGRA